MSAYLSPSEIEEVTLLDVVDTALNKGVVLQGNAIISVADVDLVFLGLNLVLASIDTVRPGGRSGVANHTPQAGGSDQVPRIGEAACESPAEYGRDDGALGRSAEGATQEPSPDHCADTVAGKPDRPAESRKPWADPDKVEQGLAKLVLTVVELLRQLLERQALRRMERGSLTDEEIERMGLTFQRLEEKMEELKRVFDLDGEELDLNLGPLGNLM